MKEQTSWTIGCLVGGMTTLGFLFLVIPVALSVPPPRWVQVMIGVALPVGGAVIAWLVAAALRARADDSLSASPPSIVHAEDPDEERAGS